MLCTLLPHWPIDRFSRAWRGRGHKEEREMGKWGGGEKVPLVLVRPVASRQLVVAASEKARSHGIRTDMTLAEARALCPDLIDAPHEPDKDLHALEALARWMTRFTPTVAIDSGTGGPPVRGAPHGQAAHATGNRPPSLFLDVTGCDRAFGGLPSLLEQVVKSLRKLRLHARVAIAPAPGAAWALAHSAPNGTI